MTAWVLIVILLNSQPIVIDAPDKLSCMNMAAQIQKNMKVIDWTCVDRGASR
jgi:hypothetical protein